MRILFATTHLPHLERSGGELVSNAVVQGLRQFGHHVLVLGFQRPGDVAPQDENVSVVARRPAETATAGYRSLLWLMRSFSTGLPYSSAKYVAGSYRNALHRLMQEELVDAVILDHTQMGWLLPHIRKDRRLLVLMHNAESAFYANSSAVGMGPLKRVLYRREGRRLRHIERQIADRADQIWVLSAEDAETMRAETGARSVRLLPAMPEAGAAPLSEVRPRFDVGLLGTWTWRPNAISLDWFFKEVYPRLPLTLSLHVAGRGAEWLKGCYPNVTYRGFVEDTGSFLGSAKVVAAPTLYGGGIETKVLSAIAAGCSIVSSPAGIRGLGVVPSTVTVAGEAAEFARQVIEHASRAPCESRHAEAAAWRRARRQAFLDVLATSFPPETPPR